MVIDYDEDSKMNPEFDKCTTYKRRWYILAIFSALCFTQGMVWNTWGPVATSAQYYYGWNDSDVAMMANWGTIMYVVTVFFWSYLFDTVGSRIPIVSSAFCIALGTGLRIISRDPAVATPLIHIAQILNGFAGPIALSGPPIISALWFPPRQRTTSTAITTIFSYLGVATAFVLGPNMVYEIKNGTDVNTTPSNLVFFLNATNSDEIRRKVGDQMWNFLLTEFIIAIIIFVCMVIYFPARPKIPPSVSASKDRMNLKAGVISLIRNKNFWNLFICYGASTGIYAAWGAMLNVNLQSFNVDQILAGWLGFYANIAGCVAGVSLGFFSDIFAGKMKISLICMMIGSTISFLWFTLVCFKYVPFSEASLYITSVLGGLFVNGAIPLYYELNMEVCYPVPEGITSGALTMSNNAFGIFFLLLFLIPNIGSLWTNWLLVGCCAACVPLLLFFNGRYNRLELDIPQETVKANGLQKDSLEGLNKA